MIISQCIQFGVDVLTIRAQTQADNRGNERARTMLLKGSAALMLLLVPGGAAVFGQTLVARSSSIDRIALSSSNSEDIGGAKDMEVSASAGVPEAIAAEAATGSTLPPRLIKQKIKSNQDPRRVRPFSSFGVGFKVDTLGGGIEFATPLSQSFNLRTGGNFLRFGYGLNLDGVSYASKLHFQSEQASIDWFPFHGGLHLSPGVLYFKNSVSSVLSAPPGQQFQLGDATFVNSIDDPVTGTASIGYAHRFAPMFTVGFGNILPRRHKHLTIPIEVGAGYMGAARMNIKLAGTACTSQGCFNMATDPSSQASINQEAALINEQLKKYQIYPIVSMGFAYKF